MTFLLTHWRLAASVLALIAAFGSGWYVRAKIADADMAKVERKLQEAVDKQRARADAAAASFELSRGTVDRQAYDTRTIIEREYRNVEVPADCVVPEPVADGLRASIGATNAAVTGSATPALPPDP